VVRSRGEQTPSTPGWPSRPAGDVRVRLASRCERPSLYGREVELAFLFDMLDGAAKGLGGASIVRGDAGIGKSTLLGAVVERARERAMTVLSTRGVQSEAHMPFAGLHQLLSPFLPRLDELGGVQRSSLLAAFGLEDAGVADPYRIRARGPRAPKGGGLGRAADARRRRRPVAGQKWLVPTPGPHAVGREVLSLHGTLAGVRS
jgi:AAA ATPase domain